MTQPPASGTKGRDDVGPFVILKKIEGRIEVYRRLGTTPEFDAMRQFAKGDEGMRVGVLLFEKEKDAETRVKQLKRGYNVRGTLTVVPFAEAYQILKSEYEKNPGSFVATGK